ncbi:MAG: hypothetical protein J6V14_00925 [Clostridia bacterium]|nr:hypothetical protein [Clostridia bacterium]
MAGYYTDNEYHIPRLAMDEPIPMEEHAPVEVDTVSETSGTWDEFNENYVGPLEASSDEEIARAEEKRHTRLKQMILRPVAAILVGVSAIMASFGVDLLGLDYLKSSYDDFFPTLPNPEPDWEGAYDWSQDSDQYFGPELYLRYSVELENGEYEYGYLVKGATWEQYDPDAPVTEGPEDGSLRYDKATNTLTLNNFSGSLIEANMMGNAFKIEVVGDNRVDFIEIWGAGHSGSVTFTGSGTLTVGRKMEQEDHYEGGIVLMGEMGVTEEFASACLMVDREVTLEVYGAPAIAIESTAMEKAIYYLKPITLTGGTVLVQSSKEDRPDEPDHFEPVCYYVTIADDDGNPSEHVVFAPGK